MKRSDWRVWMVMLAAGALLLAGAVAFATGLGTSEDQALPKVITSRPPNLESIPAPGPASKPATVGSSSAPTSSKPATSQTSATTPSRTAPAPGPNPASKPRQQTRPSTPSQNGREIVKPRIREEEHESGGVPMMSGASYSGGGTAMRPLSVADRMRRQHARVEHDRRRHADVRRRTRSVAAHGHPHATHARSQRTARSHAQHAAGSHPSRHARSGH